MYNNTLTSMMQKRRPNAFKAGEWDPQMPQSPQMPQGGMMDGGITGGPQFPQQNSPGGLSQPFNPRGGSIGGPSGYGWNQGTGWTQQQAGGGGGYSNDIPGGIMRGSPPHQGGATGGSAGSPGGQSQTNPTGGASPPFNPAGGTIGGQQGSAGGYTNNIPGGIMRGSPPHQQLQSGYGSSQMPSGTGGISAMPGSAPAGPDPTYVKPRLPVSPDNRPISQPQPQSITPPQPAQSGASGKSRIPYIQPQLSGMNRSLDNSIAASDIAGKRISVAQEISRRNGMGSGIASSQPVGKGTPSSAASQQQGLDSLKFIPGENGQPPIAVLPDGSRMNQQELQNAFQSGTLNADVQAATSNQQNIQRIQQENFARQNPVLQPIQPQPQVQPQAPQPQYTQQQMLGLQQPAITPSGLQASSPPQAPAPAGLKSTRPDRATAGGPGTTLGRGGRTGPNQGEAARKRLDSLVDAVTGMGKYQFQGQIQNPNSALNLLQREFGMGSQDALNMKISGGSKVDYGWEGNPLYDLLQDSREKLDKANAANEARYQEAKAGYQDRIETGNARDAADRQGAAQGYGNRAAEIQSQYQGNVDSLFNSLRKRQGDLKAEGQRNLGNTQAKYQNLSDSLRGESRQNQGDLENRYADRETRVVGRGQEEVDEARSSRDRNLERTKSLGREDRKRISDNAAQERARAISQSVMSGLGNSTVLGSMLSGIMDRTNRANESLSESVDQRNLQADAMLTDRVLGGLRNIAGLDANISGQGLQFSERGDERAINLGQIIGREQAGALDRGQQFNQAMGERTSSDVSNAIERSGQFGSQLASQLTGEGLSADERYGARLAQGQDQRSQDLLAMIERKDETGPNLAQMMAAAEGLGQYGRGRAGATTPYSAETSQGPGPGAGGGRNQPNTTIVAPVIGGGGMPPQQPGGNGPQPKPPFEGPMRGGEGRGDNIDAGDPASPGGNWPQPGGGGGGFDGSPFGDGIPGGLPGDKYNREGGPQGPRPNPNPGNTGAPTFPDGQGGQQEGPLDDPVLPDGRRRSEVEAEIEDLRALGLNDEADMLEAQLGMMEDPAVQFFDDLGMQPQGNVPRPQMTREQLMAEVAKRNAERRAAAGAPPQGKMPQKNPVRQGVTINGKPVLPQIRS